MMRTVRVIDDEPVDRDRDRPPPRRHPGQRRRPTPRPPRLPRDLDATTPNDILGIGIRRKNADVTTPVDVIDDPDDGQFHLFSLFRIRSRSSFSPCLTVNNE